jgi:hypothetical protein
MWLMACVEAGYASPRRRLDLQIGNRALLRTSGNQGFDCRQRGCSDRRSLLAHDLLDGVEADPVCVGDRSLIFAHLNSLLDIIPLLMGRQYVRSARLFCHAQSERRENVN